MRMTQGWPGLRTAVIALGIFAWTTTGAKAEPLLTYYTSASLNTSIGLIGPNVISFVPPSTLTTVNADSNLSLGFFQVNAPPAGITSTYNDVPFTLTFLPQTYNQIAVSDRNPVTLTGTLTGQVNDQYQSSVVATFNAIPSGSFDLAGASSTLSMLDNQKLLVPQADGDGKTTVEAIVATIGGHPEVPAPEPSTIALFLSTVGGLGLRRFVLNRRQRSQA